MVGAAGFELATPCTPCKCATRLRYAPKDKNYSRFFSRWKSLLTPDFAWNDDQPQH